MHELTGRNKANAEYGEEDEAHAADKIEGLGHSKK